MKKQLPSTVTVCSWPALFITVWLNRDINSTQSNLDADRAHARSHSAPALRRRVLRSRITRADRAWLAAQASDFTLPSRTSEAFTDTGHGPPMAADRSDSQERSTRSEADTDSSDRHAPWFELDLFPPGRGRTGSRFDDTVALPINAPQRLEAVVHAADLRLRALPQVSELGHRTLTYRARLQQIARDATQARARLDDGTYGACLTCTEYISLAVLIDRPWARQCTYCELDI